MSNSIGVVARRHVKNFASRHAWADKALDVVRRSSLRKLLIKPKTPKTRTYRETKFSDLSVEEVVGIVRHQAHRIEKSVYNQFSESKKDYYDVCHQDLGRGLENLRRRGSHCHGETIRWAEEIFRNYDHLAEQFVAKHSKEPLEFNRGAAGDFVSFVHERRSCRVWEHESLQPSNTELLEFADQMLKAATAAPNSGNRQPWRFLVMTEPEEKNLLRKLKEPHCTNAPLLIFIGMDTRLYGAFASRESAIFIDAGAAIMQMVLTAHSANLGVCWNHFARDLIATRKQNEEIYSRFCEKMEIPDYIEPIAIVATGKVKYIPPCPPRDPVSSLMIGVNGTRKSAEAKLDLEPTA